MDSKASEPNIELLPWVPGELLTSLKPNQSKFSCGLLRCQPQVFFPSLDSHWQSVFHSFNIQLDVKSIVPSLSINMPQGGYGYAARYGDDKIGMFIEQDLAARFAEAMVPDAEKGVEPVLIEYMVRRFLVSLSDSWSGQVKDNPLFEGKVYLRDHDWVAAIELTLAVNKVPGTLTILLGPRMALSLDSLWRKLKSAEVQVLTAPPGPISLEIAQIAVLPTVLPDYVRSGAIIDISQGVTDLVTLRHAEGIWSHGRLMLEGSRLAVEILDSPVANFHLPNGSSRIGLEVARFNPLTDASDMFFQSGSVLVTDTIASDKVYLTVSGERIGSGVLKIFGGSLVVVVE